MEGELRYETLRTSFSGFALPALCRFMRCDFEAVADSRLSQASIVGQRTRACANSLRKRHFVFLVRSLRFTLTFRLFPRTYAYVTQ